jgi:signal transduction histidine kinase
LLAIALENLLGNAWKFSSHQPQIMIEVGSNSDDKKQKSFYIRDNGTGFKMDYADKLFIPFQRLHRTDEFPGTGIGLSIVLRIIERHGGRIWAESEVGKGTTFFFTLPV